MCRLYADQVKQERWVSSMKAERNKTVSREETQEAIRKEQNATSFVKVMHIKRQKDRIVRGSKKDTSLGSRYLDLLAESKTILKGLRYRQSLEV